MDRKSTSTSSSPERPETGTGELGRSQEERSRHLRYAHEQYSGSGQGKFGAPKGRNLPLEKPKQEGGDYPPGTRMPWPSDRDVKAETAPKRAPKRKQ